MITVVRENLKTATEFTPNVEINETFKCLNWVEKIQKTKEWD